MNILHTVGEVPVCLSCNSFKQNISAINGKISLVIELKFWVGSCMPDVMSSLVLMIDS